VTQSPERGPSLAASLASPKRFAADSSLVAPLVTLGLPQQRPAARAAGQAASVPHMGAHALGAAAYAAKAAGLAASDRPDAVTEEIRWQLGHMSAAARAALRLLPSVGENPSGPLGAGLLASGLLGTIIRDLQAGSADPDHVLPAGARR
jgi:hypothetical protein